MEFKGYFAQRINVYIEDFQMNETHIKLEEFIRFISFFTDVFKDPQLFEGTEVPENQREYFFSYNSTLFGPSSMIMGAKHVKWYRRIQPILSLPPKSVILDFGGGFGLDSIFLASCGYKVIFMELFEHKQLICKHLSELWCTRHGEIDITTVSSEEPHHDLGVIDAVFLNEVAHHIEPPSTAFNKCYELMHPGSRLFLLEPNFFNPLVQALFFKTRGFKTTIRSYDPYAGVFRVFGNEKIRPCFLWDAIAKNSGLTVVKRTYVCGHLLSGLSSLDARWIHALESLPVIRDILSSHITSEYLNQG
jgi:2-polyprenyl-3-methyl-5-hydroxy-6-metoxy-1,4-benzoquinol methylase